MTHRCQYVVWIAGRAVVASDCHFGQPAALETTPRAGGAR